MSTRVSAYRFTVGAETPRLRASSAALKMEPWRWAEHRPESAQRLRRRSQPGLGQIALQVGADEVGAPAHAEVVAGGGDAVGEAPSQPGAIEIPAGLEGVETGQLVVGNSSGQGLGGLVEKGAGCGAQEEEVSAGAALAATGIDLSAQNLEETRHPLDFVEDHEAVAVRIEVAAGVREAGRVGGILQVEVQGVRHLTRELPGERGLAHLAWSEQDDRGEIGQVAFDQGLVTSGDHAC